jgi:hypothetical protein
MSTDTSAGIGLTKHFVGLGTRNFERSGTVQYASRRQPLNFRGTIYNVGDALPFDVGGVSYSVAAMGELQMYWDQGFLTPLT